MIRKYKPEDADAVIAVWYKASKLATSFLSEEFLAQEKENIRNLYLPNTETWVLELERQVKGFTSLIHHEDGTIEVGAIFLAPHTHGKGHGRALMDKVISLYPAVFVDVFSNNAVGRRFYDQYGFRHRHEYFHEATGQMMTRLSFPS